MLNLHNMLETLLPVIDIVQYMHNLARKVILSFWELIALYKNFANIWEVFLFISKLSWSGST